MDDISTFIWIGIGILWVLSRMVRGARKSAARAERKAAPARPTTPTVRRRIEGATQSYGEGGQGPKPIEPR